MSSRVDENPALLPMRLRYPPLDPQEYHLSSLDEKQAVDSDSWLSRLFRRPRQPSSLSEKMDSNTSRPFASPTLVKFVFLCGLWYMSSAMSSNTGKVIMNQFRYPVTLTFVQFAFVAGYCLVFASPIVRFTRLRTPTAQILRNTFPMALFQVGGHIFSSMAISRVPVSTVHTIKALSPLFTVAAYAALFGVSYSARTYLSLMPLTVGVMLACTFDMSGANVFGLLSAFGSALVFVSSNIFFKKIMPSPSSATRETSMQKLDKLNLLFYSSGMAFLLMIPLWMMTDLPYLLSLQTPRNVPPPSVQHSVPLYFFFNGTVHFGQNILAFAILQNTSPVTYSIASLIKRVAVIIIAIVWFNQTVHPFQAVGIALTFVGLWMYNSAKGDVEMGEKKMLRIEAQRQLLLPVSKEEHQLMAPAPTFISEKTQYDMAHELTHIRDHAHAMPAPRPLYIDPTTLPVKPATPSVYPSPPHSPPSTTAPSYHPTQVQYRRGTITKGFEQFSSQPQKMTSKPIAVL